MFNPRTTEKSIKQTLYTTLNLHLRTGAMQREARIEKNNTTFILSFGPDILSESYDDLVPELYSGHKKVAEGDAVFDIISLEEVIAEIRKLYIERADKIAEDQRKFDKATKLMRELSLME